MGVFKLFRRLPHAALLLAVTAAFFSTFILTPKCGIKSTPIGEDGSCGPFDEVFTYGDWFQVTGDGESCFYGAEYEGKYFIVSPETKYGPFEGILALRAPAQSNSWGFVAQSGNRIAVIINSETRFEIDGGGGTLNGGYSTCQCHEVIASNEKITLSPDGSRWAFRYFRDGGEYAIVNGEEFGPYDQIYYVRVSSEGSNWGAAVAVGGRQYAVINGRKYGPFEPASDLGSKYPLTHTEIGFSRKRNAWAVFGGRHTEKERLIVNGVSYGPYDYIDWFRWSDEGDLWYYNYRKGKEDYLVFNGMHWGPFPQEGFEMWPRGNVSNDGDSWAVAFNGADGEYVILNGRKYGPYEKVSIPVFSGDGGHYGFWIRKYGFAYAVIDGNEEGPYDSICPPFLEGSSYAYWMKRAGSWYVVVNGVEWGPYSTGLRPETSETHILLSDVAWAFCNETEEGFYIIVDGEEYGPYDAADSYKDLKMNRYGTAHALVVSKGYQQPEYVIIGGAKPGPYVKCIAYTDGDWVGYWGLKTSFGNKYRLIHKEYAGAMVIDER